VKVGHCQVLIQKSPGYFLVPGAFSLAFSQNLFEVHCEYPTPPVSGQRGFFLVGAKPWAVSCLLFVGHAAPAHPCASAALVHPARRARFFPRTSSRFIRDFLRQLCWPRSNSKKSPGSHWHPGLFLCR